MNRALAIHFRRGTRLRHLALLSMLCGGGLSACATSAAPTNPKTASLSPSSSAASSNPQTTYPDADVPDAAPLPGDDAPTDIVIAATKDGVGTSWTSVTESQIMRTAAELSNLGGAPVVLGAVGAIVALDAEPKGRARRTAQAVNGIIDPVEMDEQFALALSNAVAATVEDVPDVRVEEIERPRDLPEDAWVVQTQYLLAEDGSALRVTARVGHSDDFRAAAEAQAARRSLNRMERSGYSYAYENEQRRRYARRIQQKREPRYDGAFVFHSDPIELPEPGGFPNPTARAEMTERLIAALDAEYDARRAAAQRRHDRDIEAAENARQRKRADNRLQKALAKAYKLRAKSLEKAEDDEIDKMERLVLGLDAWQDATDDERSTLALAVQNAHLFLAEAVAQGLSGEAFDSSVPEGNTRQAIMENLQGIRLLDAEADGRLTMEIVEGTLEGVVVSLPAEGAAEYGQSVAKP